MSVSSYVRIDIKVLLIVLIFPIAYLLQEIGKFLLRVAQDGWKLMNYIVNK